MTDFEEENTSSDPHQSLEVRPTDWAVLVFTLLMAALFGLLFHSPRHADQVHEITQGGYYVP